MHVICSCWRCSRFRVDYPTFSPRAHSNRPPQPTPHWHTVWYTSALSLLRHTPVPRRVMVLLSHLLLRESFWACCQGNLVLHSVDTPTLPICLNTSLALSLIHVYVYSKKKIYISAFLFTVNSFYSACHNYIISFFFILPFLSLRLRRARPRLPLLACWSEVGVKRMFKSIRRCCCSWSQVAAAEGTVKCSYSPYSYSRTLLLINILVCALKLCHTTIILVWIKFLLLEWVMIIPQ